jgi:hypothetical protein
LTIRTATTPLVQIMDTALSPLSFVKRLLRASAAQTTVLTALALALGFVPSTATLAEDAEPEHFRGEIASMQGSAMVVKTKSGKTVRLAVPENVTVIHLTKGSYTEVDFGVYVGAVAYQLNEYSPIVRDSAVWLHKGMELRIIDEKLRGIAIGEKKWDLTPVSKIAHGWVDDIEDRVISIKWGPSDYDETDVEVPRDVPIHRMTLGDTGLLKPGTNVFVGANKGPDGKYTAAFIFCGRDGIVPAL